MGHVNQNDKTNGGRGHTPPTKEGNTRMGNKHLRTPIDQPVTIGPWPTLWEPKAYTPAKTDTDGKTDTDTDTTGTTRPKYQLTLLLDKERDKTLIDTIDNAITDLMDREGWSPKRRAAASLCVMDADVDEVPESATSQKFVTLATKHPDMAGKVRVTLKSARRPHVKWLDPARGIIRDMPEPIPTDVDSDEATLERAAKARQFWDDTVFDGQWAVVGLTLYTWVAATNLGVSASVDNVLVVGGGTRRGGVDFAQDFADGDADTLLKWRQAHAATPGTEPDTEPEPEPEHAEDKPTTPDTEPEPEPEPRKRRARKATNLF